MGDWKALLSRLAGNWRPGVLGVWLTLLRARATALTFFFPVYRGSLVRPNEGGVADQIKPCNRSILPAILAPGLVRALCECVSRFQNREVILTRRGSLCKFHC